MKLRNKKTGEIIEGKCFTDIVKKLHEREDVLCCGSLLNVDLFTEYWKEIDSYEPKEPLIKDEKVRKAVRAWADANGDSIIVVHLIDGETARLNGTFTGLNTEFDIMDELEDGKKYTIDELCGEEDE